MSPITQAIRFDKAELVSPVEVIGVTKTEFSLMSRTRHHV